jgi:type II secretory pathway pseudopilin PulG
MKMKRGLAGMFIIIVVLLGVVAWVYQNNVREAQLVAKESQLNEIRSNRMAAARLVIERTYEKTSPDNRNFWVGQVQDKIGPLYGVQVAVSLDRYPPTATIEDRTYGLSSSFILPTTQHG